MWGFFFIFAGLLLRWNDALLTGAHTIGGWMIAIGVIYLALIIIASLVE